MYSEWRGSLTQPRQNAYIVSQNDILAYLGHNITNRDTIGFSWNQFLGEVWGSLSDELQTNQGEHLS